MRNLYLFSFLIFIFGCSEKSNIEQNVVDVKKDLDGVSLVVLGTVQDGGSPHIGCKKDCCKGLFENPDPSRQIVSIGLVDPEFKKKYVFDASPDFSRQMKALYNYAPYNEQTPDGVFLTHAHIGHYTGLMFLGREAMNAKSVPVYAMPTMKTYLETNGPWSQLVGLKNIDIKPIFDQKSISLTSNLDVIPFKVPHRDEYSETVGFQINGPSKKAIFIPDIDKWEKWEHSIIEAISKVDYTFLDATFYDGAEINNRPISEIPHPFIIESMEKFKDLTAKEKKKIHFIHFNHTNPVLNSTSEQFKIVIENGFNIAQIGETFDL